MKKCFFLATLIGSSVLLAETTTTHPTTRPVETTVPSTTQPSTRAPEKSYPTPAELARKILAKREQEARQIGVAYFDLTRPVRERPADFSLFADESETLYELIGRMEAARDDADIKAVLVYLGSGSGLNMAQAQEVKQVLNDLRRAGKKTFVYADSYDTISYLIASAATDVCLLEGGEVFIPGIGFETMFYKGTLDKLGIHADYIQIGEYKGAEEPFTRSRPSEELQGEMNKLVDAYFQQIVDTISIERGLPAEKVRRTIDSAILTGAAAKQAGWVDHLVDADGLRALMKSEIGDEVKLIHDYGIQAPESPDLSNPFAIFQALTRKTPESNLPKVAVVYAEGAIVDGQGGEGILGGVSVGSEDIRKAMRLAVRNESVKAVVIRIDSPGGSALASEAMWQAVRRVASEKPVVVSIGSMAASGGYYLASAADHIIADPSAIVGSIGVVGGKFVMSDLYEKLGITTMTFQRGQNAGLFSSTSRFDDRQKRMVRTWMKNTYDQFTDRIRQTRGKKIKDIDEVARGRIFLAKDAKDLGLVDELGGLSSAIRHAAGQANLQAGDYEVMVLPRPMSFADLLTGNRGPDAISPLKPAIQLQIRADSLLKALPQDIRKVLGQQLQLMEILENRPVALMTPFVMTSH